MGFQWRMKVMLRQQFNCVFCSKRPISFFFIEGEGGRTNLNYTKKLEL